MAGELSFGFISLFLTILCGMVTSFKDGAPFDMCKYKGNAFHTAKYNFQYVRWIQPMEDFNEPSPYKLTVDKLTYREFVHRTINGKKMATSDMIKVTLSVIPGFKIDHFKGFYIKAIPFDRTEKDPRAYGTFALVHDNGKFVVKNKNAETVLCYVLHWYSDVFPIGGVSHINSDNKTEVTVYWFPPKSCDIGKIRFEATVVYNYSTYWSGVQSEIIEPEGFGKQTYPACEYYRDPMGYYQTIEKLLKNKKTNQKVQANMKDPSKADINTQKSATNAKTPDPGVPKSNINPKE